MANPLVLTGIFDIGAKLIDRLIPDKEAAARAKLELMELDQKGELERMTSDERRMIAQIEVNKLDAQSSGPMQRNWRPFIGWVCGVGLSYELMIRPILSWTVLFYDRNFPAMPSLDGDILMTLTASLLGLGVMRTTEKLKGTAN